MKNKELVDLTEEDFSPEKAKAKISFWIPGAVFQAIREEAERQDIKYTDLIVKTLKKEFLDEHSQFEEKI